MCCLLRLGALCVIGVPPAAVVGAAMRPAVYLYLYLSSYFQPHGWLMHCRPGLALALYHRHTQQQVV